MANELSNWLGSLPTELTTALADQARHWLADLNDANPQAAPSPLENILDDLLKQLRCHAEQEGNYDLYQLIPCPDCGKAALHTINHRSQAMWTDERDDEYPFERGIEVVQLAPGFTLSCRHCGHWDGEGATY